MAWSDGFFNSVNGDRTYNAQQMSEIFMGLISDGVYASIGSKLAVEPNNGMTIQVNTGRGYFNGHWVKNDSAYLQELEGSDVILKRYCAVCVRVDESDSVRSAKLAFKYSEFATNPTKPAMERGELVNEYCLAYVLIKAGATQITAADIEDTRGNNELCGWVSGLIEQLDTTTLWEQYKAEWAQFMAAKETESDNWQQNEQGDFEEWRQNQEAAFVEWYSNLQANLEGDIAATLANKVQTLESEMDDVQADVGALQNELAQKILSAAGTLLAADWTATDNGFEQTISVSGVTANNHVFEAPTAASRTAYLEAACSGAAQGTNTLTFRCDDKPAVDIGVEIVIMNI